MDDAVRITREIMEAGRKINPNIFFLAHGGPINTPEDVRIMIGRAKVQGFVGAFLIGADGC
jgi:predicted TIM-barrel enzyme